MNQTIKTLTLLVTILILTSCGGTKQENTSSEGPSQKEESASASASVVEDPVKLQQYIVQGKQLYLTYCMNCHQGEGTGLAQLYPPLAGSDYLLSDLPRAACIIKNGAMKEMTVNGKVYNQMMPGNPSLTPLEIAEILTYVSNSWGNEAGISNVKEVEKWLQECKE